MHERPMPSPAAVLLAVPLLTAAAALWFTSDVFPMARMVGWQHASGGWLQVTLVVAGLLGLLHLALVLGPGRQTLAGIGWRAAHLPAALLATLLLWSAMQLATLGAALSSGEALVPAAAWSAGLGWALGPLLAQLLGAALLEETVFRAYLWPQFAMRLGGGRRGAVLGAIASQALFALMHIPIRGFHGAGPEQVAATVLMLFLVGLVFVLVYAATRNLFIAVGAHALGNAPTLLHEAQGPAPTLVLLAALVLVCGLWRWRVARHAPA